MRDLIQAKARTPRMSRSGASSWMAIRSLVKVVADPNLTLAPDQDFTFHPNISFCGPQVLKVRTN